MTALHQRQRMSVNKKTLGSKTSKLCGASLRSQPTLKSAPRRGVGSHAAQAHVRRCVVVAESVLHLASAASYQNSKDHLSQLVERVDG